MCRFDSRPGAPMRLTKKEKELLLFMGESSIGTITISDGTPYAATIQKLYGRGLVTYHQPLLPFLTYGVNYWSLNTKGWGIVDELKNSSK
jgi:hypothetical protein